MEHQGVVNPHRLACVLVKDIYLERCGCAFCLGDWDGCDGESRRTEVFQRRCSEHSEPCLLSLAECTGILFIGGEGDGKVVICYGSGSESASGATFQGPCIIAAHGGSRGLNLYLAAQNAPYFFPFSLLSFFLSSRTFTTSHGNVR